MFAMVFLVFWLNSYKHVSNIPSIPAPIINMSAPKPTITDDDFIDGESLDLSSGSLSAARTHEQQYNIMHDIVHGNNQYRGVLQGRDYYIFFGNLSDNQPHGLGRIEFYYPPGISGSLTGAWYEGYWVDGHRSGHGVFVWEATGDWYRGDWNDGQRNGFGTFVWSSNNEWYEGDWVNGRRQGTGIYTWVGTAWYEGDFRNDLIHGYGHKYWENGDWYRGNWIRGHRHGEGVMWHNETGVLQSGFWSNDIFIGG